MPQIINACNITFSKVLFINENKILSWNCCDHYTNIFRIPRLKTIWFLHWIMCCIFCLSFWFFYEDVIMIMPITLTVFHFCYGKVLFYNKGLHFRFNDNVGFKCSKKYLKSICSRVFHCVFAISNPHEPLFFRYSSCCQRRSCIACKFFSFHRLQDTAYWRFSNRSTIRKHLE